MTHLLYLIILSHNSIVLAQIPKCHRWLFRHPRRFHHPWASSNHRHHLHARGRGAAACRHVLRVQPQRRLRGRSRDLQAHALHLRLEHHCRRRPVLSTKKRAWSRTSERGVEHWCWKNKTRLAGAFWEVGEFGGWFGGSKYHEMFGTGIFADQLRRFEES